MECASAGNCAGAFTAIPRGVDYRIPLKDLLECGELHDMGWSLRALARLRWRAWGYKSPGSANEALRRALRTVDLPVRDRIEAVKLSCTVHGKATRYARAQGFKVAKRHRRQQRAARRRRLADEALENVCGKCGALPGEPCVYLEFYRARERAIREWPHRDRYTVYIRV